MRLVVLEHERDAPAGLLADWARERGHAIVVTPVRDVPAPEHLAAGDVLVL